MFERSWHRIDTPGTASTDMTDPVVQVVGAEEVKAYLAKLPFWWFEEAKKAFRETASEAHKKVSARVRDGSGDTLHARTGQLRRSLNFEVHGDSIKTLGASVFSDASFAKYATVHEFGATIKAKDKYLRVPGGPYLNIPLAANKTPAGVMRFSARDIFNAGGYIAGRAVMNAEGVPMFALVKQVTIPARLQMVKTVTGEIPSLLTRLEAATGHAIAS